MAKGSCTVEDVGWQLWISGFEVERRFWKDPISQASKLLSEFDSAVVADIAGAERELKETADFAAAEAAAQKRPIKPLGEIKRRVGEAGLQELLFQATATASGMFQLPDDAKERNNSLQQFSRSFGTQARGKQKMEITKSMIGLDVVDTMIEHLELMSEAMKKSVTEEFDQSLAERVRDELVFLTDTFAKIRSVSAPSEHFFKLAFFFQKLPNLTTPIGGATMIVIWSKVRMATGWAAAIEGIKKELRGDSRLSPR